MRMHPQRFVLSVACPAVFEFWVQQRIPSWWALLLLAPYLVVPNRYLRHALAVGLHVLAAYWLLNHHRM